MGYLDPCGQRCHSRIERFPRQFIRALGLIKKHAAATNAGLGYVPERVVPGIQQAAQEVIDGKCERCGTPVEKRKLRQWFLKITAYADKLVDGLKDLPEWPEHIKLQQENWIGRSEGSEIEFARISVSRCHC